MNSVDLVDYFFVVLLLVIVGAIVVGRMLAYWMAVCLSRLRVRRIRKKSASLASKPEPQSIEIQVVLTGLDNVEAGLERLLTTIERIGEAANGVPITVNNYYGEKGGDDDR